MKEILLGLAELVREIGDVIDDNPPYGPYYKYKVKMEAERINKFLTVIKKNLESTGGIQTVGEPIDDFKGFIVFEWDFKIKDVKHLIIGVPSTDDEWKDYYNGNYEISIIVYPEK